MNETITTNGADFTVSPSAPPAEVPPRPRREPQPEPRSDEEASPPPPASEPPASEEPSKPAPKKCSITRDCFLDDYIGDTGIDPDSVIFDSPPPEGVVQFGDAKASTLRAAVLNVTSLIGLPVNLTITPVEVLAHDKGKLLAHDDHEGILWWPGVNITLPLPVMARLIDIRWKWNAIAFDSTGFYVLIGKRDGLWVKAPIQQQNPEVPVVPPAKVIHRLRPEDKTVFVTKTLDVKRGYNIVVNPKPVTVPEGALHLVVFDGDVLGFRFKDGGTVHVV